MCTHQRIASIFFKHDDRFAMTVPHLDVDVNGYAPSHGIFYQDCTSMEVCLDCGQITSWTPMDDQAVANYAKLL